MSGQLKVSELIAHLEGIESRHGDIPVILWDADSDFLFALKAEHVKANAGRVVIHCYYGDEIDKAASDNVRIGWDE